MKKNLIAAAPWMMACAFFAISTWLMLKAGLAIGQNPDAIAPSLLKVFGYGVAILCLIPVYAHLLVRINHRKVRNKYNTCLNNNDVADIG